MAELTDKQVACITECVRRFDGHRGALLEILRAVQAELGCIPPAAVPTIATALNLSRADVHGVISFYDYLRSSPAGRHTVRICVAEACQSMQGAALASSAQAELGVPFGGTTADGRITLEHVYCLGNCACSPAVLIDDELYGRVDASRLRELLAGLAGP
ncbi:MAG: formate dehydrogenase subunit gamma [Steroidobacteraceae bacterium]